MFPNWMNLVMFVFFGAYSIGMFSGGVAVTPFLGGLMCMLVALSCLCDWIVGKREELERELKSLERENDE